ncbi:MAG: TIGR02147 family protein [Chitinispirillaceae bacterium]|nr:TIGR02147 family protein [Chitinispirillaceae bacterium]
MKKASAPDIFNYYDYRNYLNDLVAYERQRSSVFSHRYIVQKAGFKSPTALKHVIDGKRNLSLEAANRFAAALKIEGIPRHYFLTLVLFNQSASLAEQEKYLNELLELKRAENPSRLNEDRFEVLSQWYHLAIREIVDLPDFKNSAKWIARVLCPQITPFEASQSLLLLKRLGLVTKRDGRIQPSERILATESQFHQVHSVKAIEFHRQMIQRGAESITRFPSDDREISGTTLRISRQDVLNVKMLLREFRKKLLTLAANSHEADQVYQLNFQLFPLVIPERTKRLIAGQEDI